MDLDKKICAILASDIVGFSSMMELDEDGTIRKIKELRISIDQLVEQHQGRVFHTAGDSILVDFISPAQAVQCAVEWQKLIEEKNLQDPSFNLVYRIGVNVGEVIVEQDNLLGDTVNLAARIEQSCDPGNVLISRQVFDMVHRKLRYSFEQKGHISAKNISQEIPVFVISEYKGSDRFTVRSQNTEPIPKKDLIKNSVLVLPLKNSSSDEELDYICEGLCEEIISELSLFKGIKVLSRNASFAYIDSDVSPDNYAKNIGANYVLSGSIRKLGSRLRSNIELSSSEDNVSIWNDRQTCTFEEIFDIEEVIVKSTSNAIVGSVQADETEKLKSKNIVDFTAHDYVLKGLHYHRMSGTCQENAEQAFTFFQKAIEVDPKYARAHAWSTCSLANLSDWPSSSLLTENWMDTAYYHINQAIQLDPNDAEANRIMGYMKLVYESDFESAESHFRKSHQMSPSDVHLTLNLSTFCIYSSNLVSAKELIEEVKVLNPYGSDQQFYLEGLIEFLEDNHVSVISLLSKILNPDLMAMFLLTGAFFKINNQEELNKNLAKLLKKHSPDSILEELSSLPFKDGEKNKEFVKLFGQIHSMAT